MAGFRTTANTEAKQYTLTKGVTLHEVADEVGIHYNTLLNRLRTEFDETQLAAFKEHVDRVARRKALTPPQKSYTLRKGGF